MYKPSRNMATFYVAGFKYHDGPFVFNKLKVGKKLTLVPEPDNPYDHNAVALYYKNTMIGYVPRAENSLIALLAHYGHLNIFEARIVKLAPEADLWNQVLVGLYIKDKK